MLQVPLSNNAYPEKGFTTFIDIHRSSPRLLHPFETLGIHGFNGSNTEELTPARNRAESQSNHQPRAIQPEASISISPRQGERANSTQANGTLPFYPKYTSAAYGDQTVGQTPEGLKTRYCR